MNRFQTLFVDPKKRVFIPYFTLGDPTPEISLTMIKQVIAAGAPALELGMPFTDPVADGPTNQRAMQRALQAGTNFDVALDMLIEIRQNYPELPIGLLLYFNLIFRRGMTRAYQDLAKAGVDAIVCAELPLEESQPHEAALREYNIGCVHMVFPNTTPERAQQSLQRSTAFTYVVARAGTTGATLNLATDLQQRLTDLRKLYDSPLVVGFGLSKLEHVHTVWEAGGNGAIVASCFANWIEQHQDNPKVATQKIIHFLQEVMSKP